MMKVYSCRFFLLFLALCGLIPVWAEKNKALIPQHYYKIFFLST